MLKECIALLLSPYFQNVPGLGSVMEWWALEDAKRNKPEPLHPKFPKPPKVKHGGELGLIITDML